MGKAERFDARIGLIVGCGGFALLALGQLASAFAAVYLLALVALAAGLATAKWLPRALYGKQLVTGARAGGLACGIASVGLLVGLAVARRASVDVLAQRSHLLGLQMESAAHTLHVLGWIGVALVLCMLGTALGAGMAAGVALLAAWDKNQRAIQVIERAREAAQRSSGRSVLSGPRSGQARRPTGALPIFPHYPPLGQSGADEMRPSAISEPDGAVGYAAPGGTSRADVLHDALAAWAEGAGRGGSERSGPADQPGDSTSRPASDRDNWLC